MTDTPARPHDITMKNLWTLDPAITFLNHGSFGACPRAVLELQTELRAQMEREPVRFMVRELDPLIDDARATLSRFVGASTESLAFVRNATEGVNSVLRSLRFAPGDELLTTTHEYNASRNVLEYAAARDGANVVAVDIPFAGITPAAILDRIVGAVTPRTRFALIDHITSQTALVFPIAEIVRELGSRGIDTLVDGAHGPGMLPLDLDALGCAYYTGNCHKWICAPKGAALLYVRVDRRAAIRPAAISHGANSTRTDRSRYHLEFDWTGTFDPTPWLTVPFAIEYMGGLLPGGWPALQQRNHALALEAREILCSFLEIDPPVPDEMIGTMAAVPLPDGDANAAPSLYGDPLQDALLDRFGVEVPIIPWPSVPHRLVRVSAQIYNERADYETLVRAMETLL